MSGASHDATAGSHGEATALTDRQLLVWLEKEVAREVPANNMVAVFTIRPTEALDFDRFQRAFASVVQQSDALRTVFAPAGAGACQRVRAEIDVVVEVVDLAAAADVPAAWRAWLDERRQRPFALEERAFDTALIRLADGAIAWYLCLHHLITDATSLALIHRRTLEAYSGAPAEALPAFAEYVAHALRQAGSAQHQASMRFWRDRLTDRLEPVRFYGRSDPRSTAYSRRRSFVLTRPQFDALRLASSGRVDTPGGDLALAAALLAVVLAYVHRVSGNRRIGVGLPVANRASRRFRATIGLFMEVLAVRAEVTDGETFASLMGKVRDDLRLVLLHSRCCTSNPTHNRAYEVMLNVQTAKFEARLGPTRTELLTGTTGFGATDAPSAESSGAGGAEPLVVTVHDYDDRGLPEITLDCNRAVFDEALADRAAAHLRRILDACVADPQRRLDEIDLLSADERTQIVEGFNATRAGRAVDQTFLSLFEAQVARHPGRTAVCCGASALDYAGLAARVDRLTARLRRLGAQPDQCVAVLMDRSIELLVALLATWKAAAAYVPIDPAYPAARMAQILDDAGPSLLLTTSHLATKIAPRAGLAVVRVDAPSEGEAECEAPPPPSSTAGGADRLAYVLFTSGSTGRPKGVEVTHAMLANLLLSMVEHPGCAATDRVLALTSIAFDIAACELFLPLVVGGTVDIVDQAISADGRRLRAYLEQTPLTLVQATPATWRMLIDCGWVGGPHLRLWSGGEALATDLAQALLARGSAVWNLYGPTETTVYSTVHRVRADDDASTIPIGRPIDNTRVYVLDRCLQPLPIGVTGELYIGGVGVARGYRGRPELTRERFVPDPFVEGPATSMYRTGDLAAFRADGVLVYHGRADRQIKLRGFRIEPAEIESALRAHPEVRDCAVSLTATGHAATLVAHVVAATPALPADLRSFLGERLPDYMVPGRFVWIAALPLTPNGKVDLAALAAPPPEPGPEAKFEAPSGDLEVRLAALWAEALEIGRVGRRDDFFALGGNSLLAVRLLVQIRTRLGADVSLATLFTRPTVAALAAALAEGTAGGSGLIPLQPWGSVTPIFFLRGIHVYQPLAERLGEDQPSYGIFLPVEERLFETGGRWPASPAAGDAPELSVEGLAAGYLNVIRARQPHGPYRLGGLSMGGLLAFEIAQRLRDAGEHVELLILLDTWLPRARRRLLGPWTRAHLRRIGRGDLSAVRRLLEPLAKWVRSWLRHVGVLREAAWPPVEGAQAAAEIDRLRMDHARRAAARYDPRIRPYPGRVILFRALDRTEVEGWRIEGSFGWEEVVTGTLDVIDVRGEHIGILQPPFVDTVAARLRAALSAER